MPGGLFGWLTRRRETAAQRADEEAHMSPSERRFVHENVEGHQADEFVQGHLGGADPSRLEADPGEPPLD